MSKRLLTVLAAVLMLSVLMTVPTLLIHADEATPTFNTTIPSQLIDFSNDITLTTFTNVYHMSVDVGDGYYAFSQTDGDPGTWLETPRAGLADCQYMSITYRTSVSSPASFYYNTSDNAETFVETWSWNATGDWVTQVIHLPKWGAADAEIGFGYLRFDFFESGRNGDVVDVKHMAFFATEEEANGFNYDEYIAKLEWEYNQPEETEAPTEPADTKEPETAPPAATEAPTQEVTEAPETAPETTPVTDEPVAETKGEESTTVPAQTEPVNEESDSDVGIIIVTVVFVTVVFGVLVALTFVKKKKG